MAGEGVLYQQRTFWRLAARPSKAATRKPAVRLCRIKERPKHPETRSAKRVRIHQTVRPRIADWIRRARREQARLTHALNVYATPRMAGGRSLAGDSYVEAAMRGDPRIMLDVIVEVICQLQGIGREIEVVVEPTPTDALPGTVEKVEEMRRRQERFQALHSDKDKRR